MTDEIDIKLELEEIDEENIDDLLFQWSKINNLINKVQKEKDRLKTKIAIYIKERNWDRYVSKFTDISVSIIKYRKTIIDEEQLNNILTETQLARIKREIIIERVSIITPKMKKKMKTYLDTRKIKGR